MAATSLFGEPEHLARLRAHSCCGFRIPVVTKAFV
jgi:hypothetical protein